MKMHLSSLGWVPGAPEGNRLRWSYPLDGLDPEGRYLGLPEAVVVERAPLREDLPQQPGKGPGVAGGSAVIPHSWWDAHGTVSPPGWLARRHEFSSPVQAVRFTYHGSASRLVMEDEEGRRILTRELAHGDAFHHQASSIKALVFLGGNPTLQGLGTVDLFADRGLEFRPIARIRVGASVHADLDLVSPRYVQPPTLAPDEWAEFVDVAAKASGASPTHPDPEVPEPWRVFQLAMALRWEHAVLFGHGFVDGPHAAASELDEIRIDDRLKGVPSTAMVYRVRPDKEGRDAVKASNLAVCPPWHASPLLSPATPTYVDPEVRLFRDPETERVGFEATLALRWQQLDPRALGVEIEETVGSSPTLGGAPSTERFISRTRLPEDPPMAGELARVFEVPFHDVTLSCQAWAVDAWDRVSPPSAPTAPTPLTLVHDPPPPPLDWARYLAGTTTLQRKLGDPDLPDWSPDRVVQNAPGARVAIYRKDNAKAPRVADVTLSAPRPVGGREYGSAVIGGAPLADFDGGFLLVPPFKTRITGVSGSEVRFRVEDRGAGAATVFEAGPGTLQQDPMAMSLWQRVADFAVAGLPGTLDFAEGLPVPTETADVLSYHARLEFLGRLGPAGNVVQAWRIPETPPVPPPFTVTRLGIDFYNRTLIRVTLTAPKTGKFTVWWARGTPSAVDFASKAVPGEYGAQEAEGGLYLFDVLPLPIPQTVNATVTIGVQQVNDGGGQGGFQIGTLVLPAAAPMP